MNKSELIDAVAQNHPDLSKSNVSLVVNSVFDEISKALAHGSQVSIIGFGNFMVKERAERTGRNPRTGEAITIPASKIPAFKAGKTLKDSV